MNIVVFGGGTVEKFGNDFCLKARSQGHNVIIFSHKKNNTSDENQHVIDYHNPLNCLGVFDNACSELDKIDILFFNQVGGSYPSGEYDLLQEPDIERYNHTINSHVIVPHLFLHRFKDKLKDGSKVIFMATILSFQYENTDFLGKMVGYPAGKSWATHLMHAFSQVRENKTTYVSLAPSINYDDPELYRRYKEGLFDSIYNFVFSFDDSFNGKIISAWEQNKHYPIKIHVNS